MVCKLYVPACKMKNVFFKNTFLRNLSYCNISIFHAKEEPLKKIQKGGKIVNRYQFELPMIHISKIVCYKGVEKSSDNLYLDLGIKIVISWIKNTEKTWRYWQKKSRILSTERRSQVEWNPICWVYGKIKCNIRGRRALYWLK